MSSVTSFIYEVRRGFRNQSSVIFALLFKDFRVRASGGRAGIIYAFFQPALGMGALSFIWYLAGKTEIAGVPVFLILTTGIVPYFIARRSLTSIPGAIAANNGLYGYQQVKPIDALLARYILETTVVSSSGVALFFVFYWFLDLEPALPDPLDALVTAGVMIMFTLGLSLVAGVYSTLYDWVDRLLNLVRRPMIFVSAVFHTASQLPEKARYIISFNPLAQINEHLRYYVLGIPPFPEADLGYATLVSLLLICWGLIAYWANRYRILQK